MFQEKSQFQARSGRTIKVGEDGTMRFHLGNGYLAPNQVMDAEEYFQAKRDKELGRWRSSLNPNYVVYPIGYDALVVGEHTGLWVRFSRDAVTASEVRVSAQVAFEYFEARPERKPWLDATSGEVWAITWDTNPVETAARIGQSSGIFMIIGGGAVRLEDVTTGRRIWPEDAS